MRKKNGEGEVEKERKNPKMICIIKKCDKSMVKQVLNVESIDIPFCYCYLAEKKKILNHGLMCFAYFFKDIH